MPNQGEPLVLDHKVSIRVPTQCICTRPLPDEERERVLAKITESFGLWFNGWEIEPIKGGWRLPDGTQAEEDVEKVSSNCTHECLEETHVELTRLAVCVADELSQDAVALSIDGRMSLCSVQLEMSLFRS